MKIVVGIFLCVFHVFSISAFTWTSVKDVKFVQRETATIFWSVDVGSGLTWLNVLIKRGQADSDVIQHLPSGLKKKLPGRDADLELIINGSYNIVNVTFTLRNLARSDQMRYKITVTNSDGLHDSETTFLKVLALPVLQFQPNQIGFCVQTTVNITCTVTFNDPSTSNFTFFINSTEVATTNGTQIRGNTSRGALMSKSLLHVGAFTYTCLSKNENEGLSGMSYLKTILVKDPPHIISCKDNIVEEGSSLFWQCSANGSEPLSTSWHRGNNTAVVQSGKSLTINNVSRDDGGLYTFKASNGEGCAAASKTVQLDVQSLDLRACLDVSYALVTNSCLVSIPADGFPKPNLTCDVHNATKHNYTICSSGNVDIIGSNCHISNSIRSCNFTIPVFARGVSECFIFEPKLKDPPSTNLPIFCPYMFTSPARKYLRAAEGVENKGMSPSQDIASGSQVVVKMKDNASTSKTGSK